MGALAELKKILRKNSTLDRDCPYTVPAVKNKVNLNGWFKYEKGESQVHNVGDYLAKVAVEEVAKLKGVDINKTVNGTRHLYATGSVLLSYKDQTVWGSGFLSDNMNAVRRFIHKHYHKTDVRAVRGPKTRELFLKMGIACPEVYGDPALLAPMFYQPKVEKIEGKISIVPHYSKFYDYSDKYENCLGTFRADWRTFVDDIASSSLVISSSLHGIILAETYGVPAILLDDVPNSNLFKYEDYYFSTGRYSFAVAHSIEEAKSMSLTPPDMQILENLRKGLIDSFPTDIFE